MSEKERILKDIFKVTSARYICQGIGFFSAIALRKFLGPFYMGMWGLLKVLLGYVIYLFLGVDKGAAVEMPFFSGKGDIKNEEDVKNSLFSFVFLISVLTGCGLLLVAYIFRERYPLEVIVGLVVLSVYVVIDNVCYVYQILLRAKHNFSVLSKAMIFDAVVNLLFIITIVSNFKTYGLYATILFVAILNVFFIHFFARYSAKFMLRWDKILGLIKKGLPITIIGLLQWLLGSIDRMMIAKMIGITFLGYYSIPIMAKTYAGQISSFGTVLYPRLMEAYGNKEQIEDIKKYVLVPTKINAYMFPVILGFFYFAIPFLVRIVLPKFMPGILAMQILLLGIFFESCRGQAFHFIIAVKKQMKMIPVVVGSIILNILCNYVLIRKGYGIYGVAAATTFVTLLSFIFFQVYAMRQFASAKKIFVFLGEIIIPLIYMSVVVLFIDRNVVMENIFIELITQICLLLIFSVPLLVYIDRNTSIFRTLGNIIYSKMFFRKR